MLLVLQLAPLTGSADDLSSLIADRLAEMRGVAAYKWHHGLPVEDLAREAVVLESATYNALQYGIEIESSRRFFKAQIAAAKDIQHCWFGRWQAQGEPESGEALSTIRERLLALGTAITRALANAEGHTLNLTIDCLSSAGNEHLNDALAQIQVYPDRLTQIEQSGVLRVGTTGDYAPFSFAAPGATEEAFSGIDIDLAHDLAAWLGVELHLVKTTWPTLMQDLAESRYDIAMSGVSIIPARQTEAFFTAPYHIGGKTPITRCIRVAEFDSLDKIDRPGVRVIVNPGGTNERFVDASIQEASKVLHEDNRSIFHEIISGHADLMITDQIEVHLQSNLHPELCPSMPGKTLTYQEKGYMMPQEAALKHRIDEWLSIRTTDGSIAALFTKHLNRLPGKP